MNESTATKFKFRETYCSQCGEEFGPGDSGFSHCDQHLRQSEDEMNKTGRGKWTQPFCTKQ